MGVRGGLTIPQDIEKQIRTEVDECVESVNDDAFPPAEQAFQNIYWNEDIPVRTVEFPHPYHPKA